MAGGHTQTKTRGLGYRELTVDASTAQGFSGSADPADSTKTGIPKGASYAVIIADAAVYWRDDGTAPTSSRGMPILANGEFTHDATLAQFSVISQTGSAKLRISFYE